MREFTGKNSPASTKLPVKIAQQILYNIIYSISMKLSKQSKELMLFFTKNNFNYIHQTSTTNKILKNLYNEIMNASIYCKNIKYKITVKKIENSSHIPKPVHFNANSFPREIMEHIDKSSASALLYSFSLYDRKVKVYFVIENDIDIDNNVYNEYIESIATWLYMLHLHSSKKCAKKLAIYFYFTSHEKILPTSNAHTLNELNVNTAFTTTCPIDSEIIVYRKEEWFKVFIHETFHNFGLDFSMMDNEIVTKEIISIFKVKSHVNGYEAYAEFWAEIINILFCCMHTSKNKKDSNEILSMMERYINLERAHSLFQLTKTLDFMGLSYNELYSNTNKSSLRREKLYKENTNVLSYYIIKSVLLTNYQGFLHLCSVTNKYIFDFTKTNENLLTFCKFIERNYKSKQMLNGIDEMNEMLIRNKKKNLSFILSNLRMSICELV